MKRLFFIFAIFCLLKANAQNYLISFAGTGGSNTVSSVKVENLTAGTSLIVNGSDILRLTVTTGVNPVEKRQSSELKIYPNPTTGNSVLAVYPPVAGRAVITVFDLTGKPITQIQSYLENYLQEFRLSGIKKGVYLISVKGNTYQYSGKLLSNGKADGKIIIDKIINNQAVDKKISQTDYKGTQATVDMAYSAGNRLKFTGISGIYSTVMTDIPATDKTITFNFIACTDADNNNYPVVAIGTQIWMAENLKTTKYRNSAIIETTTPATLDISGETTPKYQWAYAGNESNVATYGRLYSWNVVSDSRNICPTGWHIPTEGEWNTLTSFLGELGVAGGKLKETGTTHWTTPNTDATNETGFTALPGGQRISWGTFDAIGNVGYWWTATEPVYTNAIGRYMHYGWSNVFGTYGDDKYGLSVRCLKD
jgi:uncharacterized protein (TIGR02145 family)